MHTCADFDMRREPRPKEFFGTMTPGHLRILRALMAGKVTRKEVDRIGGVANGPDLISTLTDLGLVIESTLARGLNRDGRAVRYGVYTLQDTASRQAVAAWLLRVDGRAPKN